MIKANDPFVYPHLSRVDVMIVQGAYGRKATREDWLAGKDVHILGGPYMSIRDCKYLVANGFKFVQLEADGKSVGLFDLNTKEFVS